MFNTNKIQIDGDGNIALQNIQGSTITIHKGDDAHTIMGKLNQLHDAQLDALQQILEQQAERFSDSLKVLLKGVATQKNIVPNSTLVVGRDAHIGDKVITYEIHMPNEDRKKSHFHDHPYSAEPSWGDIDANIIQEYYDAKFPNEFNQGSIKDKLTRLRLLSKGKLNKSAIIFFCNNPELTYPNLDTIFYIGDKVNPKKRLTIYGHIKKQEKEIRQAIENELRGDVYNAKGDRVPLYDEDSQVVIREILLNAFLHRDYEDDDIVRVQIITEPLYSIRIENPGRLPKPWKDILITSRSIPVNNEIYGYAVALRLLERQGRGTSIIKDYLKKYGEDSIVCDSDGQPVSITINLKKSNVIPKTLDSKPYELTTALPKTEDLSKIIGREQDLRQVRDLLQEKQKVVVVNGLGGIGKTTLAQAYLTRYGGEYANILWLNQSEGDNFVLDLITVPGLTLNLGIDTNVKDAQALFTEIVAKLKSIHSEKPNLLVIDNANAFLSKYFDYLPKPPQWHVLATAREKITRFFVKDLDFLSEADAVLLFRQHCQRITDETQIKAVLRTVDYHTLTIEILAKTAQRYDTPLSTLQHAIERDLKTGVHIPHKGDKIEKVASYLLSIFDLAPLSMEEKRLLQHFAALPAEFISYDFLKTILPESEEGIAATLQNLHDKAWLLQKNDPEAYKMHLVIAEVVKRKIPPTVTDLQGLINKVADLLAIDDTKDNPVDKFPFIPYGEAVLAVFPEARDANISILQNELAIALQSLGDYAGAKALLEKAVHSDEANFGEAHPTTAARYSNLAIALQSLGDYAGAKALLEKAVRSDEANFGEAHPTTAVRYSNLATVLQDLGDYAGAKALLEKALRSDEANFGEAHPTTAVRYSNLALVLQDLGDYTGAKALLEKALRSDEANFGEAHPTTAVSYSSLALVLKDLGDYAGAKALLEKALRSDEANFGEAHPTTAVSYSNLAVVLQDLGDYKGAKVLLEKALRSAEANFGDAHPTTAVRYSNLATVLKDLGDYAGAKPLLEKTVKSMERHFGKDHPNTAQSYSNLALVLQSLGDYAGAKALLEKAVLSDETNFGEAHPTTAVRYSNLALVLQSLGDYAGAKALLEKALRSDKANFGEEHPTSAVSYSNLALVLQDLGDYKEAFVLMFKAYQVMTSHFEENHPYYQRAINNLNNLAKEMLKNGWTEEQIIEMSNG